jgi:Domain of unknown function (DUF5134)
VTPAWLLDAVAALMLAVAAVSAVRLAPYLGGAVRWRRGTAVADTDVAHLLMALAMAGMLAPGLRTLPGIGWEVVFGMLAAWFAVRVTRDARANGVPALAGGHCAPHFVHCCSMIYMFAAVTAGMGAMPGMAGWAGMSLRYPALALAFALVLGGYCIWDLDQLSGRRHSLGTPRVPLARMATPGAPLPAVAALADPAILRALRNPLSPHGPAALYGATAQRGSAAPHDVSGAPPATAAQGHGRLPGAADGTTEADGRTGGGSSGFLLSPAVTVACRVAMGFAMAFMLLLAI